MVPGLVAARDQLRLGHRNLCWAYVYSMMVSWKRQQSVDARQLVANVAATYLSLFDADQALPWSRTEAFYGAAGLRIEPPTSVTIIEWIRMLRVYGPLSVHGLNNSLSGGHVRLLYGIQDFGSDRPATMLILDPWMGADYGESFEKFRSKYEGGGAQVGRTVQIGHF